MSVGDAAGIIGVGCSLGLGEAAARGAVDGSGDLVGWGFGVLSGSSSTFFFGMGVGLAVFLAPVFFLAVFDFDFPEEDLEGLAVGVGRALSSSSSAMFELADSAFSLSEAFSFLVLPDFFFAGVLLGFGDGAGDDFFFFFFGEAVGVGVADLE